MSAPLDETHHQPSRTPPTPRWRKTLHRAIAAGLLLVLPPALATLATWADWRMSGGEEACYQGLDLDTPGLACAEGLLVFLSQLFIGTFHLLIVLPALFWIVRHDRKRADRSMARRAEIGTGVLTLALWMARFAAYVLHLPVAFAFGRWAPFATDALVGILLLRAFPARHAPPTAVAP
jgi:hypothetical protein